MALSGALAACSSAPREPQASGAEVDADHAGSSPELGPISNQSNGSTLPATEAVEGASDDVVTSESSSTVGSTSSSLTVSTAQSDVIQTPSVTDPSDVTSTMPNSPNASPTSVATSSSVPPAVSTSTIPSSTGGPTTTSFAPATTTTQPQTPAVDDVSETMQLLDDFESYGTSDSVPTTWFNYGNAGGGVSMVGVTDSRVRSGQLGDNKLLAWGFDAVSDPGYGGVGKEYASPQNWSQYSGVKFWFYGSGEGGSLQIEIGEDKTSDVERYRGGAFTDNQVGWQIVRVPFDSFSPASWNPTPGNEVLDLVSVENIVFAVNSGATTAGVAIDDVSL